MKNQIQTYRDPFFDSFWNALIPEMREYERKGPSLAMRTDIKETEDAYELDVELPGFKKDEIDLSFKDGYLTISVAKTAEEQNDETSKTRYLSRERFYGQASRRYYIGEVDRDSIKAKFADGVLTLSFPKETAKKAVDEKIAIE